MRTLHRCMICSSLLHDTHTAVLINTAVLILHCRTIYQKKKPTGTIIPMSFLSCFPHATSHPHFTIFVFSTHKNSKNIKTGWKDNKVKSQLRLLFLYFYERKLDNWNEKKIGRLVTSNCLMPPPKREPMPAAMISNVVFFMLFFLCALFYNQYSR